jgi:hypothetical protein
MKRHRTAARTFAAAILGLVMLAPDARGDAPPVRETLRERAALMSAMQTLERLDTLPASLRTASAVAPLSWLTFKRSLNKFSTAGGSGGQVGSGEGDVGIGTDPVRDENEPAVATDPHDDDVLVAGSHSFDPAAQVNRCVAYFSRDGGEHWSRPFAMPQLTPASTCSDPVLAYAPEGGHAYYTYMDIKVSETIVGDPEAPDEVTVATEFDILVSRTGNGGRTWSRPVIALDADPSSVTFDPETGELIAFDPGSDYDKPWIGTHVPVKHGNAANRERVYVSATRFDTFNPGFACDIAATRSTDRGASWSPPTQIDTSGGDCGDPILVQGSRPTGGLDRDVLVAWYHSGNDGPIQGAFNIRTAFSENGRDWERPVRAARERFETPFFLGPFAFYHRWSGTMFPDVEIGPDGWAHIVYAHDPEENGFTVIDPETGEEIFLPDVSTTAEDGDIRYITSRRAGSGSWSHPVTLNDDGRVRAQGYPALETTPDGDLLVLWMDHRRSPERTASPDVFGVSSNLYYDIFATARERGRWSRNFRVTEKRSISDFLFVGDYNDLATSGERAFGIWTDRRHQDSIGASVGPDGEFVIDEAALEDNVFGAVLDD